MLKKQPNSHMCFVCGMENPIGLKLFFYEDEAGRVIAHFTPRQEHQGYPGVLHGGITAALLDEIGGRIATRLGLWMTTAKMEIRYRQPIPLEKPVTIIGEMTRLRSRTMEGRGEVRLEDGTVAAEATSLYVRIPDEQLEPFEDQIRFWDIVDD